MLGTFTGGAVFLLAYAFFCTEARDTELGLLDKVYLPLLFAVIFTLSAGIVILFFSKILSVAIKFF